MKYNLDFHSPGQQVQSSIWFEKSNSRVSVKLEPTAVTPFHNTYIILKAKGTLDYVYTMYNVYYTVYMYNDT